MPDALFEAVAQFFKAEHRCDIVLLWETGKHRKLPFDGTWLLSGLDAPPGCGPTVNCFIVLFTPSLVPLASSHLGGAIKHLSPAGAAFFCVSAARIHTRHEYYASN